MRRLLTILRDPVAWVLVVAGIVELETEQAVARGAILFAGSALILADRIRSGRGKAGVLRSPTLELDSGPLQEAVTSTRWFALTAVGILLVAVFDRQSQQMTVAASVVGILALGWAWLTVAGVKAPEAIPPRRLLIWGGAFLALGLWELMALLGQPSFSETSYDSPTLSYLFGPVLDTYPGRAVGLGLWVGAGRGLIRRA